YKDTLYSVRILPFGGFTSMEDDNTKEGSFFTKPFSTKVLVLVAGSVFNIILGYVILVILTAMNGYVGTTTVIKFDDNAVSRSFLQEGDNILKLNNHRVRTSNDITYELLRDPDGLINFELMREGKKLEIPVQFQMQEIAEGVNAIKMDFFVLAKEPTPLDYVTYPINWSLSIIKQVWGSLIDLFTGRVPVNQLSGPVGIVGAIGKASKMGLDSLLLMTAFIAINLGVFNLLHLPILDG
ncbi:MAG: M50 family metallopeptidase, partial [Oscillospiraceae bacterium]